MIPVGLPLIWEPFVKVLEDAEVRKQIWTGKDEDGVVESLVQVMGK